MRRDARHRVPRGPAAALAKLVHGLLLAACGLFAAFAPARAPVARDGAFEWPARWDGRPLTPLAPSEIEQRFAARFPGAIVRLADGGRQLVLRRVDEPTRMLHPAADCFRGLGYRIAAQRLEVDAQGRRWRCFDAVQGGRALRVCERIADADGRAYTDASAWFWAALLGRSKGPWLAVTTAQPR